MKVDAFLDSGVTVDVPDGTDLNTDEGYLTVKAAARVALLELLKSDGWDVQAETRKVEGYRYLDDNDQPLFQCPKCGKNWTQMGGVNVVLSVNDHTLWAESRVDAQGRLLDTQDHAIANGYHAGTCCGGCEEMLNGLDGVNECTQD